MASSSSCNWLYDVFPSFSGEDIRKNFLSHFLKELDRKLIISFKDNEIKRSHSIGPELEQAIKDSRIAVVLFSKNYASSSWCLNELLEIVKCKEHLGQIVIPVFYGLDPSHVRKQTGDFGKIFENTCQNKTEEVKIQWKRALTDVANLLGYHSATWGEDVRVTFLSHFLKEVDRKFIVSFIDNEIERGQSLDPNLKEAIRTSRIVVVVFCETSPSSGWCLNELTEIMKMQGRMWSSSYTHFLRFRSISCQETNGKFGKVFAKTCKRKTEEETTLWSKSLADVADLAGYDSKNWHNEAKMIEKIVSDVLDILNITPANDFVDLLIILQI